MSTRQLLDLNKQYYVKRGMAIGFSFGEILFNYIYSYCKLDFKISPAVISAAI